MDRYELWDAFCQDQQITKGLVPLFDARNGIVQTHHYGNDGRLLLRRSAEMEEQVRTQAALVRADYQARTDHYEGLIYLMATRRGGRVVPLYIGKTEKYGKGEGNLSANLETSTSGKFCRWGYAYAYHLGDLSAATCPGHAARHVHTKYQRWAARLFWEVPTEQPRLREPVLFWTKAWPRGSSGIWSEWGRPL